METASPPMSAGELLAAVRADWAVADANVIDIASRQWRAIGARAMCPEDAETCRLVMLSAASLGREATFLLWRSRAQSRFLALRWDAGVASIIMTDAFRALTIANHDYPLGKTMDVLKASDEAISILEELAPFTDPSARSYDFGGPRGDLISRFIYEKTGFLLALKKQWDEAAAFYSRALRWTEHDTRGHVKVQLGRALVNYLADLDNGGSGRAAMTTTARWAKTEAALANADLASTSAINVERMAAQRRDLICYEIL